MKAPIVLALGVVLIAGSDAASQTGAAPAVAKAADDFTVVGRIDNTQTVDALDTRLLLTKAKREEHAVVRRLLFISATLRLTEPVQAEAASSQAASSAPDAEGPAPQQTCRWTYRAFLQRQICFTSMSGLSSCTQPEILALPDEASGAAPLSNAPQSGVCNDIFRPAVTARIRLSSALLSRAKELYAADQQTKVDPLFKAAGVRASPDAAPAAGPAPPRHDG